MNYHTALDVSLRSVSIFVVNDGGKILFEAKVSSEHDAQNHAPPNMMPRITIRLIDIAPVY